MLIASELKEALTGPAEQPGDISHLLELVQKWADPMVLEAYHPAFQDLPGPVSHSDLAGCAPGTLGQALYDLARENGSLDGSAIWQVLTGYGRSDFGRCCLDGFLAAHYFSLEHVLRLAALLIRISFVAPEATVGVMNAITTGWTQGRAAKTLAPAKWAESWNRPLDELRQELNIASPSPQTNVENLLQIVRKIPPGLKALFWEEIEAPIGTTNIIEKVSGYGGAFDETLRSAYVSAMLAHPGVAEAYQAGFLRPSLEFESLRDYQQGTLAYAYYHQIVDNGLDVEIIKRRHIPEVNSVTDYAAHRILQTHDLWHPLTGYTTDGLDELALQTFQLAQLGSPFSSNLLATVITRNALFDPQSAFYIFGAMCEGWPHGLATAPFLPVRWEEHWGDTIEELRQRYHIQVHSGDLTASA
jgi:ubiquinone biosynthesis protein Coq4